MRTSIAAILLGTIVAGCGGASSPTPITGSGDPNATATLTPVVTSADRPAASLATAHLDAARLVGSAMGERLDRFVASELFAPLGVSGAFWVAGLRDGLPHAGGGLYMRTRDLAKIGQLMLDGGTFRGQRVIDAAWLRESTARATRGVRTWGGRSFDYGYQWWVTDDRGGDIITAAGAQGQFIFVSPRDRLVVAVNSDDEGRWTAPIEFLFSHILPAVQ